MSPKALKSESRSEFFTKTFLSARLHLIFKNLDAHRRKKIERGTGEVISAMLAASSQEA